MVLIEAIHQRHYGESYVRCYVWANSVAEALTMAATAFAEDGKPVAHTDLTSTVLLYSDTPPFATLPSDSGWED